MNAATSGAFVLSESYLYTVEMIVESLDAPGARRHRRHPVRRDRLRREAEPDACATSPRRARRSQRLGVEDVGRHLLVATSPGFVFNASTVLVKREPFTPDEVQRFSETAARIEGARLRWAPPATPAGPVASVIGGSEDALAGFLAAWPYDVGPVTTTRPSSGTSCRSGARCSSHRAASTAWRTGSASSSCSCCSPARRRSARCCWLRRCWCDASSGVRCRTSSRPARTSPLSASASCSSRSP